MIAIKQNFADRPQSLFPVREGEAVVGRVLLLDQAPGSFDERPLPALPELASALLALAKFDEIAAQSQGAILFNSGGD